MHKCVPPYQVSEHLTSMRGHRQNHSEWGKPKPQMLSSSSSLRPLQCFYCYNFEVERSCICWLPGGSCQQLCCSSVLFGKDNKRGVEIAGDAGIAEEFKRCCGEGFCDELTGTAKRHKRDPIRARRRVLCTGQQNREVVCIKNRVDSWKSRNMSGGNLRSDCIIKRGMRFRECVHV